VKTAHYSSSGGPLTAEVTCAPKRDGSYSLTLWKADENAFAKRWEGNFINTDDDSFKLPGALASQDGRLVEAMCVIAVPHGASRTKATLVIRQDDHELARIAKVVPPGPGSLVDLFVQLVRT
jgi:hypothetical protein